jgi:hypothetical protein
MKWWQKVKNIFAGKDQKLRAYSAPDHKSSIPFYHIPNLEYQMATVNDWLKVIESIQVLVYITRRELEPMVLTSFDWNALSVTTYLNHIERLVIKVREYYLSYKHYEQKGFDKLGIQDSPELKQFKQTCEQSYHTLLNLSKSIKQVLTKEGHEDLSHHLHALELELSGLGSHFRVLTQMLYKQEFKTQSQDYKKTNSSFTSPLISSDVMKSAPVYIDFTASNCQQIKQDCEEFKEIFSKVPSQENRNFLLGALEAYEILVKCYVVARKSVIQQSLDTMRISMHNISKTMQNDSPNGFQIFSELDKLFHAIEVISFNTNRESRFSQNMFEKSKVARRLLRKACLSCEMGCEYLKEHAYTKKNKK